MFCSSCGKPMDAVRLRCPACHRPTGAFWLNLCSLIAIGLLVAANYFYLDYVLPVEANVHAALGRALWLPTRVYLTFWRDGVSVAPWLLGALVLLLVVWRWKTKRWPASAVSGVLLSAFTWLLLIGTLAGMGGTFMGSVQDSAWFFDVARDRIGDDNERMAVAALRHLQAAEAAYRQKNPKLGFTCKLADLRPPAAPEASGYRLPTNGDLYGSDQSYYYLYKFSFSGCSGTPNPTYRIDAAVESYGLFRSHNFCTDQTGEIRAMDRRAEGDCMKKSIPVLPEY